MHAIEEDSGGVRCRGGVELADTQLAFVKVEPAVERSFPVEKESVGRGSRFTVRLPLRPAGQDAAASSRYAEAAS